MTLTLRSCRILVQIAACVGVLVGCERTRDREQVAAFHEDHEYVCVVAIDLSGSFQHQMADDGQAYSFLMSVLKRYYDDHSGTHDKVILAQLSGTNRSLLWEGTPLELRRAFPTADRFRKFLLKQANPNGSMIHDGVRHALEYVASDVHVSNGKAKSAFFVLSDMLDNAPDTEASREKLVQALTAYGKQGHVVGFYFVDQFEVAPWRQRLRDAGVHEFRVEAEFYGTPPFPTPES